MQARWNGLRLLYTWQEVNAHEAVHVVRLFVPSLLFLTVRPGCRPPHVQPSAGLHVHLTRNRQQGQGQVAHLTPPPDLHLFALLQLLDVCVTSSEEHTLIVPTSRM